MSIVIYTRPGDSHTNIVEWALKRANVSVAKVYLSDLPQLSELTIRINADEVSAAVLSKRELMLPQSGTVWFRRLAQPVLPPNMHEGDRPIAAGDWFMLARYLYLHFIGTDVFCVNPPQSYASWSVKPYQLQIARKCGLTVPNTLISNQESAIVAFIERNRAMGGDTIVKTLTRAHWIADDGSDLAFMTTTVSVEDIKASNVRLGPAIYQRRVEKAYECRAVVMGRSIFAVRLDSQAYPEAALDFRRLDDWSKLGHQPIVLPDRVSEALYAFMDALGLVFAVFDFAVGSNGEWTFFEANEFGNWLWIEACRPEVPLLDAFVQFLKTKDPSFHYRGPVGKRIELADFIKENKGRFDDDILKEKREHVEVSIPGVIRESNPS